VVTSKLSEELGISAERLSYDLHEEAKRLADMITPDEGGLTKLQELFLRAYWYKSEEKWRESWLTLGEAICVAYELRK
jgi:hypothetical protein